MCLPSQFGILNSRESLKLAEGKFKFAYEKHRESEIEISVATLKMLFPP